MKKSILFLGLAILFACTSESEETQTTPKIQTITESVYASVRVLPQKSYYVQSAASGIIDTLAIQEGDVIKQGDLICKIRAESAETRLTEARISLEKSRDDFLGENSLLKNLKLELETAHQQLEWDSIQYKRLSRLWDQKIGSENTLEQSKLKFESSQNRLLALKKQYEQTQNDLKNSYEMAHNRLQGEKSMLSDFTVRSLMDGRVYEVNKEVGEIISQQERLAEIGSQDSFKIEMDVDEVDVALIELSDTAIVVLDAYPEEIFKATVVSILPKKDVQNLTYTIRAQFVEAPKLLYGLSGEANIIVGQRAKALTLPPEYLFTENSVMTPDGEVPIKVGMKNMQFVEVLSGIDSSTIVIKAEE
jgi:multidrug efflux pump subunit AcrA (membrane-fusion protein)